VVIIKAVYQKLNVFRRSVISFKMFSIKEGAKTENKNVLFPEKCYFSFKSMQFSSNGEKTKKTKNNACVTMANIKGLVP